MTKSESRIFLPKQTKLSPIVAQGKFSRKGFLDNKKEACLKPRSQYKLDILTLPIYSNLYALNLSELMVFD